jgi:hypothetical protein
MSTKNNTNDAASGGFIIEDRQSLATASVTYPQLRDMTPEAIVERMVKRVRDADSLDALFSSLSGNSSVDLVGHSFRFEGVEWQPYDSQHGVIPQAICAATDLDSGESQEFVTTATMLTEFLHRAEVLGLFPFNARIVEKTTKSGNKALNFERLW